MSNGVRAARLSDGQIERSIEGLKNAVPEAIKSNTVANIFGKTAGSMIADAGMRGDYAFLGSMVLELQTIDGHVSHEGETLDNYFRGTVETLINVGIETQRSAVRKAIPSMLRGRLSDALIEACDDRADAAAGMSESRREGLESAIGELKELGLVFPSGRGWGRLTPLGRVFVAELVKLRRSERGTERTERGGVHQSFD